MKYKFNLIAAVLGLFIPSVAHATQIFEIDASHASIGFTIDHLVISKVRGDFRDFTGTIVMDDDGSLQDASSTINVSSLDTGIENRDNHLRGADFFDVGTYPQINFKGKNVKQAGNKNVLIGELTMHGVTREIALPFMIKGPIQGLGGETRIGFQANTIINRKDYGLTWNKAMETGGLVVGEEVELLISLEAVKKEERK